MIEPGAYKHYKGGPYRVLFVVPWWSRDVKLDQNDPVYCVPYDHRIGARLNPRGSDTFLIALWSGNDSVVLPIDTPIVIYVALYADGRICARTVAEFEERVQSGATTRPRCERIGS